MRLALLLLAALSTFGASQVKCRVVDVYPDARSLSVECAGEPPITVRMAGYDPVSEMKDGKFTHEKAVAWLKRNALWRNVWLTPHNQGFVAVRPGWFGRKTNLNKAIVKAGLAAAK